MILSSNNLTQHIHSPTHIAGNTLDLVISNTNLTNSHSIKKISDHSIVHFHINSPTIIRSSHTIQFRQLNKIDIHQFIYMYTKHYIKTSNLTSKLELSLSKTIDQFALPKQKLSFSDTTADGSVKYVSLKNTASGYLKNIGGKKKLLKTIPHL